MALSAELRTVDEGTRTAVFVVSTRSPVAVPDPEDPSRTVPEVLESFDLGRYRKNPVVLWAHRRDELPIGTARELAVTDEGLEVRVAFAKSMASPMAETVWQAVREGLVRAASVSWAGGEARLVPAPGGGQMRVVRNAELLEFSLVPVPADPDALVKEPAGTEPGDRGLKFNDDEEDEDEERAAPCEPEPSPEELRKRDLQRKRISRAARTLARSRRKDSVEDDGLVLRLDYASFGAFDRSPSGGLRVPARLTRTGVLEYRRPDGMVRRELRLAEEVFREDSLRTLRGAPVTVKHPPLGEVIPQTWRRDSVGHVGDAIRKSDGYVEADLVVQDAAAVEAVERGDLREISAGYRCKFDPTPGTFEGSPYDGVQRGITYNHVALLPRGVGRAGPDVSLRLDAKDLAWAFSDDDGAKVMKTIRIDGKDFEIGSDAHLAKVDEIHAKELAELMRERDTLQARCDSLDGDLKKAKDELAKAQDPKALDGRVRERASFLSQLRAVLGDEVKLDGKTDRELMVDAIRGSDKDFKDEGRSDDYVRARFDLLEQKGVRQDSVTSVVNAIERGRRDDQRTDATPEKKPVPLWRQPLSASKDRPLD